MLARSPWEAEVTEPEPAEGDGVLAPALPSSPVATTTRPQVAARTRGFGRPSFRTLSGGFDYLFLSQLLVGLGVVLIIGGFAFTMLVPTALARDMFDLIVFAGCSSITLALPVSALNINRVRRQHRASGKGTLGDWATLLVIAGMFLSFTLALAFKLREISYYIGR